MRGSYLKRCGPFFYGTAFAHQTLIVLLKCLK